MNKSFYFTFSKPSLLDGLASNSDLFGNYNDYNYVKDGNLADSIAIYDDFCKVGEDFKVAINSYEQEQTSSQQK